MVQDRGIGHVMNSRISGGRNGFGFSTAGSARVSNCSVDGVQFGVSVVMNRPGEVLLEDNDISAKLLVRLQFTAYSFYYNNYDYHLSVVCASCPYMFWL